MIYRDFAPPVLDIEAANAIEEFLRFRHVVRHIYAFELDPERIERLASRLRPAFRDVSVALLAHATYLEGIARNA